MRRSFPARVALVAFAGVLLINAGGGPCDNWGQPGPGPSTALCGVGAFNNVKITGTITDVDDVFKEFSNPNYSNTREQFRTAYTVTLDLTATAGPPFSQSDTLTGTAHIVWQQQTKYVYRQTPGACSDGLLIDSNVREWTVNLTGSVTCDGQKWTLTGSGSPDGSEVPQTVRYHEDNCHPGCTALNCPDSTDLVDPPRFTWNFFSESGIVFTNDKWTHRVDETLQEGYQGESYREVKLELSRN